MPVLNIRNLSKDLHARLRVRAARAGRSMESEARHILERACRPSSPKIGVDELQAWVASLYGKARPRSAVQDLIAERRREAAAE